MNKRMAKLETLITNMCNNNNNNNCNNGGGGNNNSNNGNGNDTGGFIPWRNRPFLKQRNMGVYCHSCGFHPVGEKHTSATCGWKKPNHDDNATWTKRGTGGSTTWPTRVREDQKTHESYAGKSATNN